MRPLRRQTIPIRVGANNKAVLNQQRKPEIPDGWIYVETGDPDLDTPSSPTWMNSFYYLAGRPIAFRHGNDGQTDMIGMYDLTLGAVSGDIAFLMPLQWAMEMPPAHAFPVELDTNLWAMAVQTVDIVTLVSGEAPVRIFWPTCGDPCTT